MARRKLGLVRGRLLFEFMDLGFVPDSLRHTLRDLLEVCNGKPFRGYLAWVGTSAAELAKQHRCTVIAEMGAGAAPLTELLMGLEAAGDLTLVPCDINPDKVKYQALGRRFPDRVQPILEPVDFAGTDRFKEKTLFVYSSVLHHVDAETRLAIMAKVIRGGGVVAVYEPLNFSLASVIFCLASLIPSLLTPLVLANRPGSLRRVFWCWVMPVAPVAFVWDGVVSCLRMWTRSDWQDVTGRLALRRGQFVSESSLFTQKFIAWGSRP